MASNISPIVGVFDEPAMADRAIESLTNAGFSSGDISYSGNAGGGGFLSGLKSLFTGGDDKTTPVIHNLVNMGVPEEQANYYASEHQAGHPVVAVRAGARSQEARQILSTSGGREFGTRSGSTTTGTGTAMGTTATAAAAGAAGYEQIDPNRRDPVGDADVGGNRSYAGDTNRGRVTQTGVGSDPTAMDRTGQTNTSRDAYAEQAKSGRVTQDNSGRDAYSDPTAIDRTARTNMDSTNMDATRTGNIDRTNMDATRTGNVDSTRAGNMDRTNMGTTGAARPGMETDEQRTLRLREEQLRATKQTVQGGEVRLHKDIVEEQQSINVPVTHEEVYIERHPATGDATTDTTPIGQDEVIRVPIMEEQVNVTKSAVETGEVTVSKRAVTENERFTDTVRHEEARVDREGDAPIIDNAGTGTRNTIDNAGTGTRNTIDKARNTVDNTIDRTTDPDRRTRDRLKDDPGL